MALRRLWVRGERLGLALSAVGGMTEGIRKDCRLGVACVLVCGALRAIIVCRAALRVARLAADPLVGLMCLSRGWGDVLTEETCGYGPVRANESVGGRAKPPSDCLAGGRVRA